MPCAIAGRGSCQRGLRGVDSSWASGCSPGVSSGSSSTGSSIGSALRLGRDLDDLRRVAREAGQGGGQVAAGAGHPGGQGERHGERRAVQPAGEPGLPTAGAVELLDQPRGVVHDQHQPAVAEQAAAGPVLDLAQRAPREPAPVAAEPDPDALGVGDEQRGAGVDQGGEVADAEHAHHARRAPSRATAPVLVARAR